MYSGKNDKYEYLTAEEILATFLQQANSPLGKVFDKQMKTIQDKGEKEIKSFEEHEQTLVKSSVEKQYSTHSR